MVQGNSENTMHIIYANGVGYKTFALGTAGRPDGATRGLLVLIPWQNSGRMNIHTVSEKMRQICFARCWK